MFDTILSWDTLWWVLLFLYVPACIILIAVVLLQKGKSMGFAGAFGVGGGQDSLFGPRGGNTFISRLTYAMAAVFMILALVMSLVSDKVGKGVAPELAEVSESMEMEPVDDLEDLGVGGMSAGDTSGAATGAQAEPSVEESSEPPAAEAPAATETDESAETDTTEEPPAAEAEPATPPATP